MYNEAKKLEYIDHKKGDDTFRQNMTNWFLKAKTYEQKLDADLSTFSVSDIIALYRTYIHTASDTYLEWIHRSFRDYAAWVNPDNHYGEISREMLTMCVNKDGARTKIIMRNDLISELDNTFVNYMEKCLLLGLFEGLLLTDFDDLEEQHIEGNIVHIPKKRDITVSDKLIEYMIRSARTYRLIAYADNPKYNIDKYLNLDTTDKRIIKMMEAFPKSDRMMRYRNIIKRCKEISGNQGWVNAAELPQSGSASMLLDYYRKEKPKKLDDVVKEHTEELRARYGVGWRYDVLFKEKYGFLFE